MWIWQQAKWPDFTWDEMVIKPLLRRVCHRQGVLFGRAGLVDCPQTFNLDTLLANIIHSSAIEGEQLNASSVRSSLAKRLGIAELKPYKTTLQIDGYSDAMIDAMTDWQQALDLPRLLQWHAQLFPKDYTLFNAIEGSVLRSNSPMQVVSGRLDRPVVHFEAPPREILEQELAQFIEWFNISLADPLLDPLIRAAIAHFWFVTIHPFEDGNGRLTRLLTDMALAQAESQSVRFYAMSVMINQKRNSYYAVLEQCQRGDVDITLWIEWFLQTLDEALCDALKTIELTLQKTKFWLRVDQTLLLQSQVKVLNRLLDGDFSDGISAKQYQSVAKVSRASATRHLAQLVELLCLKKTSAGGRSTRYVIYQEPS